MLINVRISWPLVLAAVVVMFLLETAFQASDWAEDIAVRLIERPLTEMLRLSW